MAKYLANSDDITIEEVTGTDSIKFNTKYSMNDLKSSIDNICVNTESTSTTNAYSADYINDCNTYSENETFTGKYWIDGKPIYRKVFTGNSLTTATTVGNIGSYQDITLTSGYVSTVISGSTYKHNIGSYLGSTFYSGVQYRPNGDINIFISSSYENKEYKLIVEYTKSS